MLSKNVVSLTTIPEGKNIFDIAQILSQKKIVDAQEFLQLAFDQNFLKTLNIEAQSVEGYLYPNSYDFQSVKDPKKIISMMVREFFERTKDLDPKVQNLSFQEMLILASMVEKETGHGGERKKVAGVFFNRLRDKMRLQSDPTTIYGILVESKGKFSGNITKNDLLTPSPYNTYTVSALPKGPISNPGIEAMEAVLDPENHKFYYFVSMNDGTHVFSENYEEHLEAVRKWQMNASNRKDRSWRDLKK